MGRIQKAYETKFAGLLRAVGARRRDRGLRWLLAKADALRHGRRVTEAEALERVWQHVRRQIRNWQALVQPPDSPDASSGPPAAPPRFLCDAGLGGLARWVRAAGYEAFWTADIDDDELLTEARRLQAVILTTDSMLMERRVLRNGTQPAVWVPPTVKPLEQLRAILDELNLPLRATRCMACGGPIQSADKEALRERIPPRTYRWLDQYFVCAACGKLYWHGTHWRRIQSRLHLCPPAH